MEIHRSFNWPTIWLNRCHWWYLIERQISYNNSVQLFITSESTLTLNGKYVYNEIFICDTIINSTRTHKPTKMAKLGLNTIVKCYISALQELKITLWSLELGNNNNKISAEKQHNFWKKRNLSLFKIEVPTLSILQNIKTSQYAWYFACIDNKDVLHYITAVGEEFKFSLDVDISTYRTLDDAFEIYLIIWHSIHHYFRCYLRNANRCTKICKMQIKTGSISSRKYCQSICTITLQLWKIIVQKISYRAQGPFRIIRYFSYNPYSFQQWNDAISVLQIYKVTELYLLLTEIYLHEILGTIDQLYLNY